MPVKRESDEESTDWGPRPQERTKSPPMSTTVCDSTPNPASTPNPGSQKNSLRNFLAASKAPVRSTLATSSMHVGVSGLSQPTSPMTSTPQPPCFTSTPQPPGLPSTPQPPGFTSTSQPQGFTSTPQPQGLISTPQPSALPGGKHGSKENKVQGGKPNVHAMVQAQQEELEILKASMLRLQEKIEGQNKMVETRLLEGLRSIVLDNASEDYLATAEKLVGPHEP